MPFFGCAIVGMLCEMWLLGQEHWRRLCQVRCCLHWLSRCRLCQILNNHTNRCYVLDNISGDAHLLETASLYSFGFHSGRNESRDAKQLSILEEATAKSPPDYEFEVRAKSKKTLETFEMKSSAILLQDYLPCLERHWPLHFEASFGGTPENLKEVWSQ